MREGHPSDAASVISPTLYTDPRSIRSHEQTHHDRRDVLLQQAIDQPVIILQSFRVDGIVLPSQWYDPRPGYRETVSIGPEVLEKLYVVPP